MKSLFIRRFRAIFILTLLIAFQTVGTLAEDNAGQKTDYIYYKGDKVARVKVHEEIRREGAELISKVVSRVEMWADGVGSLTFSFRANAFVKGTANALKTTPPGDRYLQVSRNIVTYTSDKIAYAGATQKTVSRFQVPFAKPINRSFQMDGSGNDSYRIGYTSSSTSASDYLDPYAWAKGSILGGNENFQPGSRILESEAGEIINLNVDANGNPVDPNTETRPCGHLLSASGDHSLQASCSVTNNRGQRCTVTNFYACQSHTHTYPATSPFSSFLTVKRRCQRAFFGHTCSKGGYTTGYDTHTSRCGAWHTYWDCDPASVELHKARTCARCSNTYRNCEGARNPCTSGLGHTETVETSAEAPSTPQPNPSPPSETSPTTSPEESDTTEDEEQETEEEDTTEVPEETPSERPTAVCGSGHTYFTDVSYVRSRHRDRTCTRCSQTYQNCSNHSSACQGSRWHTEDPSATPTPSPPTETPSETPSETPTETPSSPPSETPTPSPPTETPSPPNNNEDTDDDTDDAPEAPPAPAPTIVCPANSWTNCGGTTSHASTCTGGHTYYTCGTANAWHQDRTCTRCSQTYQNCGNSATACQGSKWHTETPQVVLVACGAASWTGCTSQLTSSTAHQVSCSAGHSYWTCGTANAWHKDRTCSRCRQTYQNCSNSATACQGSRWHTE